jgi:hypothetical protein
LSCGAGVGADPESHYLSNALYCGRVGQAAVSPGFVAMTSLWYKKDERESTFSSPFLTFSLSCSLSLSLAVLLAPANIDR